MPAGHVDRLPFEHLIQRAGIEGKRSRSWALRAHVRIRSKVEGRGPAYQAGSRSIGEPILDAGGLRVVAE